MATKQTKVTAADISQIIRPRVMSFVGEFIDYLDGIPSKNICPNGRILKSEYTIELKKKIDLIVDNGLNGFERKKTLGYLINSMMSTVQFCNMAGFNLVNLFGNFKIKYNGNQNEIKNLWHNDMMRVLTETLGKTLLPGCRKPQKIFIATSEDYEIDKEPNTFCKSYQKRLNEIKQELEKATLNQSNIQELLNNYSKYMEKIKNKNTNSNEFNTYIINSDGTYSSLKKEALNVGIFHNYHIEGHTLILNIHNSSSLSTTDAIKEIHDLLELFNSLYAGYRIIICGDSNVYYNNDNVDGVTQFGNMLRENGYNLLASRYIPLKKRPQNFFQNAQSAEKGYKEDREETMFIAYPTYLQALSSYDHDRYFIVQSNPEINSKMIFDQNIWAFEGAHLGFDRDTKEGWEGIDICNYHEYLFSDHIPIYMDIEGIRIIAANNASVRGQRGINYNQNLFQDNITVQNLEQLSNEVLVDYFSKIIMEIINSLIQPESGHNIIGCDIKEKYNQLVYTRDNDDWGFLKNLCQFKVC